MFNDIKQKLCKHKDYEIIKCIKEEKYYVCRCMCGYQFSRPKAIGEMYTTKKEDIKS